MYGEVFVLSKAFDALRVIKIRLDSLFAPVSESCLLFFCKARTTYDDSEAAKVTAVALSAAYSLRALQAPHRSLALLCSAVCQRVDVQPRFPTSSRRHPFTQRTTLSLSLDLPYCTRIIPHIIVCNMAHRRNHKDDRDTATTAATANPRARDGLNEFFVDGEGINRQVLQSEICKYLGAEATSRPFELHVLLFSFHTRLPLLKALQGRPGYKIRSIRPFTAVNSFAHHPFDETPTNKSVRKC